MSKCRWLSYIALGWCLVWGSPQAQEIAPKIAAKQPQSEQQEAPPPAPIPTQIEVGGDSSAATENEATAHRAEERSEADLVAQESMARSTEGLFFSLKNNCGWSRKATRS